LFVIPQRSGEICFCPCTVLLFVIPQRSGEICF